MGLQLPNLDDRTYTELVDEARRLIPTYDPKWTNHNPSDPGITLIEMFAYLTELLLYRLNLVTDANRYKFLKLLNGPAWTPTGDLASATREAVLEVRARWRAVTAADYEQLALDDFIAWLMAMQLAQGNSATAPDEWWARTGFDRLNPGNHLPNDIPAAPFAAVKRALCVSGKDLDQASEADRALPNPSHVSLVILPGDPTGGAHGLQPSQLLVDALSGFLDERRMVTTRHHVIGPCYAPISADIVIVQRSARVQLDLPARIQRALVDFLDPLTGGVDGRGWPFGRDVYVSDLCKRLEAVEGVDYIADLALLSLFDPAVTRCVPATALHNSEGELYGLQLANYHLPLASTDSVRIMVAPATRMVRAQLFVTLMGAGTASDKRRTVAATRAFFGPFDKAPPDPILGKDYLLSDLRSQLLPTTALLELCVDSAHALESGNDIIGMHIAPDELIEWSIVFAT